MELVIHIELRNTRGAMGVMNQTFELPDAQSDPINEGEGVILDAFTLAQTQAYERYLAAVAREAAEAAQAAYGGTVVENSTLYRVDGEIGRITFPTYAVQEDEQILWNSVPTVFGAQGPREFYATRSAKELLLDFSSFSSYRTTARVFNRVRRSSGENRTPVTTIAAFVHREGIAVQAYLGHFVTSTLAKRQFTADGVPQSESNPVYQRPIRSRACPVDFWTRGSHIETPEGHDILNGLGTVTVLQFVIAFLLHKDLLRDHAVQFFVDGARSWHADILAGMRWSDP